METSGQSPFPFALDPFQQKAIEHIEAGNTSVIVAAPTGAGKTLIAEFVIDTCLKNGSECIYTAPIKALSNQKFRDFRSKYGENKVGIITGDVRINAEAPILIMTTEIYRNILLEEKERLNKVRWIIFDEIHYMDDFERGTVWEESLMLTPQTTHILALSATIPNLEKISQWLQEIHKRPLVTVREYQRPVPLSFYFQYNNTLYHSFKEIKKLLLPKKNFDVKHNRVLTLVDYARGQNLLPAIYFSFSRRRCETLAKEVQFQNFLSPEQADYAESFFKDLVKKFDIQQDWATSTLTTLIRRGIAFHHAGLLPSLKEIIERMFSLRLIQLIFTTETFALGINMPARSVIFDAIHKFYGGFERALRVRDFQQMAGRAGRRNIDTEGFVFLRLSPFDADPRDIERLLYGSLEEVQSQFNNSYATLLHLYQLFRESIYSFYELSFHYYQYGRKRSDDAKMLIRNKITLLKNLGYIEAERLTRKGEFAATLYGYELIFAELFENGILESLTPEELCVVISAVIYEPRKGEKRPHLNPHYKRIKKAMAECLGVIHRQERHLRIFPRTKQPFFYNADLLVRWYHGQDFWEIIRHTDTDEGEVVRHLRMCIQILREMMSLPLSPEFKQTVSAVRNALNRDIVDAEKQLTEEI